MTAAVPAVHERARDRGLVRGVGVAALTFTIVNGVVGSGIFRLPASLAGAVGAAAPLAYLGCAVAMGAVVLCCAEAGSRVPTSGGLYGYVEAGLGPLPGFVGGFLGVYVSAVLACGGVLAAVADIAAAAMPALAAPGPRIALIAAIVLLFAAVNLRGVGFASRAISVVTIVKLLPLLLFVAAGAWFVSPANLAAGPTTGGDGFGRALIFALFAFSGMETPLAASGEVAEPSRTVPRALILSMLGVLALYVAIQLVAQGLLGAGLAGSKTPLADAGAQVSPALGALLLAAAGVSMLFWIAGDLFGAPRALFAFGRDGFLPAALGRLSPSTRVPHVAIFTHAAVAFVLAATGTFERLTILAALASTILYALACISAWRLRRMGVAALGEPARVPALPLAAVVGVAAMAYIFVQAEWVEIGGSVVAVAACVLIYALSAPRRRALATWETA